ncbi:hypothetical protein H5410_047686 [Solanum commersonii]|uniref:Uncharacterized protein n=1 Tax=Solanum commersonii TaxID=4109 RepID=A0A9J5XIZ8_SOLCO|nr:hypothetical protein H5410_047686 [Solanum commersonii]
MQNNGWRDTSDVICSNLPTALMFKDCFLSVSMITDSIFLFHIDCKIGVSCCYSEGLILHLYYR